MADAVGAPRAEPHLVAVRADARVDQRAHPADGLLRRGADAGWCGHADAGPQSAAGLRDRHQLAPLPGAAARPASFRTAVLNRGYGEVTSIARILAVPEGGEEVLARAHRAGAGALRPAAGLRAKQRGRAVHLHVVLDEDARLHALDGPRHFGVLPRFGGLPAA